MCLKEYRPQDCRLENQLNAFKCCLMDHGSMEDSGAERDLNCVIPDQEDINFRGAMLGKDLEEDGKLESRNGQKNALCVYV